MIELLRLIHCFERLINQGQPCMKKLCPQSHQLFYEGVAKTRTKYTTEREIYQVNDLNTYMYEFDKK